MTMLTATGLHLRAGERTLVQNLDVKMAAGETWMILGANGSGKTTLLHTLAGLRNPDAGTVFLNGKELSNYSHRERARHIGILFQDYEVGFPGKVSDTVLTSRYPHSNWTQLFGDTDTDRHLAQLALDDLDMSNFADRNMISLSGGERRRAQVATLTAQTARVQLLDEPTNHLDLRHQVQVLDYCLRSTRKSAELVVSDQLNVVAIHDINLAVKYGSHAILLYPDGASSTGRIGDTVDLQSMEALYQCRLTTVRHNEQTLFLPI